VAAQDVILALIRRMFPGPSRDTGPEVPVRVVRKRVVEAIGPILERGGFAHFDGNKAWRHCDKWVDVVEVNFIRAQYRKAWTTTPQSPSLAAGRYLTFVPEDALTGPVKINDGRAWPSEPMCHFRKIIYKSFKQRETKEPNIWFVGIHGEYLDECLSDMRHLTETQIIPWFNRLDDLDVVLQLLLSGSADMEGKDPDPVWRGSWNFTNFFSRHVVAGLVAFELEQWGLTAERLAPVIERGGVVGRKGQIFPLPRQSMEPIEAAYATASQEMRKQV
jgi:hypothetical protein